MVDFGKLHSKVVKRIEFMGLSDDIMKLWDMVTEKEDPELIQMFQEDLQTKIFAMGKALHEIDEELKNMEV